MSEQTGCHLSGISQAVFMLRRAYIDYLRTTMKNVLVIDGARNCVYDIFVASEEEFAMIFPAEQDVAFIDEVMASGECAELDAAFTRIWARRIPSVDAMGIHGTLFYELDRKKVYYPTRKDEEATSPGGGRIP